MSVRRAGIHALAGVSLGPTTIFQDLFTAGADVPLQRHTPDVGWYWDEHYNPTNNSVVAASGAGYAKTTNVAASNNYIQLWALPSPTGADCEVEVVLSAMIATAGYPVNLIARAIDRLNYYVLIIYPSGDTNDLAIYKVVAGVATSLATYAGGTIASTDTIKLELIGTALTGYQNGVARLTVSDATFAAPGQCGLGFGRVGGLTYGTDPLVHVNAFRVGETGGAVVARTYTAVFDDRFTEGSDTALTAHTPSYGTSWSLAVNTTGGVVNVIATGDYATPTLGGTSQQIIALCSPAPATANVEISSLLGSVFGTLASHAQHLVARYQDSSNFYCATIYNAANAADCQIWKVVAGVATQLGAVDAAGSADVLARFQLIGSNLKLFRENAELLSVTDSAISAAGGAGIAWGNLVVSTDRVYAAHGFSSFVVREIT